ncbi:MAG: beta strand repeat-containing protein [Aestuariivirga sp.]
MTTTPTVWKPATQLNLGAAGGVQTRPIPIGLANGDILAGWFDNSFGPSAGEDITARNFDPFGNATGGFIQLNTVSTADDEDLQDIKALPDGGYIVTYIDEQGAGDDVIRLERYDANGAVVFSGFVAAGGVVSNAKLSVASNGNYMLTFTRDTAGDLNLRAHIFNGVTNTAVAEFDAAGNGADDFRNGESAGLSNNNFVTVCHRDVLAGTDFVEFKIVNSAGAQVVAPTTVASNNSFNPDVAGLSGGGFVVAYTRSNDLFFRIGTNAGALGAETTIASGANSQNFAKLVALKDGGFFVVWQDSTAADLIGQRYSAAGATIGSNIIIDATLLGGAAHEVSLTSDGRILVSWFDGEPVMIILDPRDDTITGTAASEVLTTQTTDTVISGLGGSDTILGLNGNDTIDGGVGTDTIKAGGGNDTIKVAEGHFIDNVDGEGGSDTLDLRLNTTRFATIDMVAGTWDMSAVSGGARTIANIEIVKGTQLGDTMTGGSGSQTLEGEDGLDLIKGGADGDILNGGGGLGDYVIYSGSAGAVTINLTTNTASGGDATGDSISNFENVIGGDGADKLTGSSGDNILSGGLGNDILKGENGNDKLEGDAGADSMTGGLGDDTYVLDTNSDSTVEAVGEGTDKVVASVTHALRINVENLELSGNANINGTGNALDNIITGNTGNNILNGLAGKDTLRGFTGNDQYRVDNALDLTEEQENDGIDITFASIDWVLQDNIEKLYLESTATSGTGNDLSNFIFGTSGQNTLDGGIGADRLSGFNGNDLYIVDSSGDLVFEQAGQGIDEVQSSVNHTLAVNVENLTLTGAGNVNATGNTVANLISGNSGNNFIDGKQGNDTLTGGLGGDNFVFTTALVSNQDTITDFSVADDTIRLDDAVFTAIATGFLNVNAFKLGVGATEADDRIVYNSATGEVFYDADGTGAAAQVRFAFVTAGTALTQGDFFVF